MSFPFALPGIAWSIDGTQPRAGGLQLQPAVSRNVSVTSSSKLSIHRCSGAPHLGSGTSRASLGSHRECCSPRGSKPSLSSPRGRGSPGCAKSWSAVHFTGQGRPRPRSWQFRALIVVRALLGATGFQL